ncbi:MAG: hypothetical protein ACOX9E_15365, partial [Lentisphaeria bacterium]
WKKCHSLVKMTSKRPRPRFHFQPGGIPPVRFCLIGRPLKKAAPRQIKEQTQACVFMLRHLGTSVTTHTTIFPVRFNGNNLTLMGFSLEWAPLKIKRIREALQKTAKRN